jgi:hypothetical protein
MADIPQVLATYDALLGVALGAGLTYGFGALNRRRREVRGQDTLVSGSTGGVRGLLPSPVRLVALRRAGPSSQEERETS